MEVDSDEHLLWAEQGVVDSRSALVSFPEYFHSAMRFRNYSDLDECKMFEIIRVSNRPALCSMNVKKASPFKEIFNVKLVNSAEGSASSVVLCVVIYLYFMLYFRTTVILERGIMSRLYKKYKWETLLRCTSKENNLVPQTPTELAVAYLILSVGTCAAFVILCLERLTAGTKMRSSLGRKLSMIHPLLYVS